MNQNESKKGFEEFSVYNNLLGKSGHSDNPLHAAVPDDYEHGWHVSRNLLKHLNHLDFLARKEEIAIRLGLHSIGVSPDRYEPLYQMLEAHQARKISTSDFVTYLTRQLQQESMPITEAEVRQILVEYATIRHMEFHPTDVCNLKCHRCTYGQDDPLTKPLPINFPFSGIKKIAQLRPRSMVISGGGEPTLFKNKDKNFQDVVDEIQNTNPGIRLALVTNGTYRPSGDWPNRLSWIRVSLDAATPATYNNFRGKPMFERVIRNYLDYLAYDVPQVGINFLFSQANVHEYATVAQFIFDLVSEANPGALHKVNIQYRPLRRDPYRGPFPEAITQNQINRAVKEVQELLESSQKMREFLRKQTNITAVLGGNTHIPHEFSRCYYSQTFKIVRANGDLRPCFIRATEPDFVLGNLLTDSLETIALNTLFIGDSRKPHCDAHGCRQSHANYTFEQGLKGNLKPSTSPEVLADPMY